MKTSAFSALTFSCGKSMKNRFMLAPMTNQQSHPNGTLSEDEFHWLTMRAKGGFGLIMTCAAHVQAAGQGFPGQLGIFDSIQEEGHRSLAKAIKAEGSLAVVQLHHAGMRSPAELIGRAPMAPSNLSKYGAEAMSLQEVENLRDDFILAAKRAKEWGYDGVEVHGAHGYILTQFLSSKYNHRTDNYGGSLENRSRLLFEILQGIRNACGPKFLLAVRLSPERFGMDLGEVKDVCKRIVNEYEVDFIDLSLWDWRKDPEDPIFKGKSLLQHFMDLDFKGVKVTVAGKISSARDVNELLEKGIDFVTIGKAAILHYNFPQLLFENESFKAIDLPVSSQYLKDQGLGDEFVKYMKGWPGFVA